MQLVKQIVYKLKRQYGQIAILRRQHAGSKDYTTGVSSLTTTDYTIKKAILLPVKTRVQFSYDLAFIAANKNFTYGGMYDRNIRTVIIDAKDIPIIPQTNDEVIFGNDKYIVLEITNALDNDAYILITKGLIADGN